jgi:mannose-6-phosphate isomerase-like protein (cupin superfamily)
MMEKSNMTTVTFDGFKQHWLSAGFDEVLERTWPRDTQIPIHTHPFTAQALVQQGEMWLTLDGQTQHLTPGCTFHVPSGTPHAERYGPEGAVFWVARKNS